MSDGESWAQRLRWRVEQFSGEVRTVAAGATGRDRLRILRILCHAHLRIGRARRLFGRGPAPPDPPRPVTLSGGERLVARRGDAIPLYEQFGLDVYGAPLGLEDVRCIVDLGANVGFATLALRRHYPQARFVCVEPVADNQTPLRTNLEHNGVDAQIHRVAIVGAPGPYALAGSHFPGANRMISRSAGDTEGVTLTELLERADVDHVDLLKIDIEGAERGVFANAHEWAPRVRAVIGELHDGLTPAEVSRLLGPHGFRRKDLGNGQGVRDLCCFVRG